jgi:nucleoside-diphosphate-sugar epimerase
MMARIAVTGASGFVARHLIPLLIEQGHEVHGIARYNFILGLPGYLA